MDKYLSVITINVNGLNVPIKRHRIAEWKRKHDPHIHCLQETHVKTIYIHWLKMKRWKNTLHANRHGKNLG